MSSNLFLLDSALRPRQNVAFNSVTFVKNNPTQATNITTAVSATGSCGVITTQAASAAAGATQSFAVNSSYCSADSVVKVGVQSYGGTLSTNGIPVINVSGVTGGQFTVNVSNAHSANALNGNLFVNYEIL